MSLAREEALVTIFSMCGENLGYYNIWNTEVNNVVRNKNILLHKTTRSSPHHMAQHRPTASETTPPYAPEAADLAQNRPLWRMMSTYGAMQS